MAVHHLHTTVDIEASAEQVWNVLTDFPSYPEWNPFMPSVVGEPQRGSRLQITIRQNEEKVMRFAPRILAADYGRELRWLGHFLFPGLFDGEHSFVIVPLGEERVRFEQSERFSGLLVGMFRTGLDRDTKRGFEAMNHALKIRAEGEVR